MESCEMNIERDKELEFHGEGTLNAVTRWISSHDEGIAEWLKNARRAYQADRANVDDPDRVAVILLKDLDRHSPARIGLLDVGGATIEDLESWRVWDNPHASSRSPDILEEETQGNGGKAYMFRLFSGATHILGVGERTLNRMGFDGLPMTEERGTPGFVPSVAEGREVREVDWSVELNRVLRAYGIEGGDLPSDVIAVLQKRKRFTLVEGEDPVGLARGRIDPQDLLLRVLRHDQSTLALQQVRVYAIHNGTTQYEGRPLALEPIPPYPGQEGPFICEVPADLPDDEGVLQSTTQGGSREPGRLILCTSKDNMHTRHKVLRPRWKLSYRAGHQMLGSKSMAEIAPATPGAEFIYGEIELEALAAYVHHGRTRPKDGPLIQAVDLFIAIKVRERAKEINDRRRHKQDSDQLDEVQRENKLLDKFKNKFMPTDGAGGNGNRGVGGPGPSSPRPPRPPTPTGEIPAVIELGWPNDQVLRVGKGVPVRLATILRAHVRDDQDRIVPGVDLDWVVDESQVVRLEHGGVLRGRRGGTCNIYAKVRGTTINSRSVPIEVWVIDHVLLTPRSLEILLGKKERITAEVTNDNGERSTEVLLEWRHDADDQFIVRINPSGEVFGNRVGRTSISAGGSGVQDDPVWARVHVEVEVKPNPEVSKRGSGFPQLKLTDRDADPITGDIRAGSPDQPTLWQEVADEKNNIWWLNLQSEDAAFAIDKRPTDIRFWRMFHAGQLVEMVVQVHMAQDYTKGDDERPEYWFQHKQAMERNQISLKQVMWQDLKEYVETGRVSE